jgi:CelD/BcsL family acetyltransferase involved in cellulose biosynthesis
MNYTITQESFDSLDSCWADSTNRLSWNSVFVLPAWLKAWWQEFGAENELYLTSVKQGEMIIGIAPLVVKAGKASLLGSVDVCDYLDFIVAPGMERDFFNVLLDDLKQKGISHLDLRALRPDSTVLTDLVGIARSRGHEVLCQPEDVSSELDLPTSWEEYLATLTAKQRHELRRKLRRLSEAGKVDYYFVKDSTAVREAMDTFIKMFAESREDKATFLTAQMESFFRSLADTMAEAGLLRLGILELDTLPTAMIMCFDYNDCLYLYNSGYAPQYNYLSVGLLCKVLCIKESIQEGKKRFDFLKGDEPYKYQLGGREVPLYRCQITIK